MYLKQLTLILLCLSISFLSLAQCPTNINFDTQAEIDNFSVNYPGCTAIPGDVSISGYYITNLNGLSNLTLIGGGFYISTLSTSLTSLDGLENLTSIGGTLGMEFNDGLTNIDGLSGLTTIGGDLYISLNPLLANVDGLAALTSVSGNVFIGDYNEALTNINGLSALMTIGGDLSIIYNTALTNIDGLSALTTVGGNIEIAVNDVLTDVDGLSALSSIGGNGSILISSNPLLTHIVLPNLTSVGPIGIYSNDILTDVQFPNLTATNPNGGLVISNNPLLTNLDGFSSITSFGAGVYIRNNASLMNVDGLGNLTSIGYDLVIENNPQLSMCCALCPILQADADDDTVIGNNVNITNNAVGCDEADIFTCPTCTVCAAVDLDINFDGSPTQTSWEMTDASGNVVASSGGNIYGPAFADSNLPLNGIACLSDGCYDLTFFDSANDGMCPRRTSTVLTGVNIATIGLGGVFNGIPRVASSCGSYSLTDANGTILAFGGGRFGTSETTNFCVSGGVAVPLWQSDNIYAKTLTEDVNALELSPNPAQDNLTIYYNLTDDFNADIQVIDITGKIILEIGNVNTNQAQFDISNLASGFYFVKLMSGDMVLSEKFVKQ